ncbi:cellulase family glycosylhydrolase [Cellvibrio japonicus]|uniref:Endoglucanase n=1 Tax=Cellvibrio japonicus (strain Ueda107) TaxID=498211 RepID=B3PCS3_CELJU|nr:cellulase family glycosylhydrolase [Cellvibrio japonicus]ACE84076.1 endo-1,4-beta glucanase, cel5B [Cellvibrio japonicus Ueda107]QEI13292.1 cellulase family glycosylhydrolase [Cellvibrio japonicus]QEI16866.1 cellulase family glycosylhydrolase [Cellvibrio japonicus]QEI20444.1 cellulase family glycosylhydrolase [Cellvibrio japonicus]
MNKRISTLVHQTIGKAIRNRAAILLLGSFGLLGGVSAQADVAPLSVQGNKILANGQPASFSGMSLFWSNTEWGGEKYYNAQVVSWLKSDWNAKLVRAAMGVEDEGGYLTDPANKDRVTQVVDAAIANDMYVIIDWHSHNAHQYQSQAIAFFQEMARKYGANNHVIYEIYNEPLQVSWSNTIKPYAQAVIAAIRAIDPDNLIIVGTPTWSQDVDVAANDPITGYQNIAYTLHFYAGTHGQYLRDKAQTALNRGIALFVTEWGSVNANGDGAVANSETNAWVSFMKTNHISNANWALNDKVEGASALVPGASANGGWVNSQLTASGALAKSIISGWPSYNTSSSSSAVSSQTQVSSSSQAPVVSSSSSTASSVVSSAVSGQQCNWYGTLYPLCSTTTNGWGWENNASCIARATCSGQPAPWGIVGGSTSSQASSSVRSSSSSLVSSSRSSSSSSVQSSSAPSSVASSSGSSSGQCSYTVTNQWSNGFTASIRIANNGTSPINGWNLSWSYSDGSRVTNSWNANVSGNNPYTASNLGWNGSIQPGQAVEFGFQGTKNNSAAAIPTLSGNVCNN